MNMGKYGIIRWSCFCNILVVLEIAKYVKEVAGAGAAESFKSVSYEGKYINK